VAALTQQRDGHPPENSGGPRDQDAHSAHVNDIARGRVGRRSDLRCQHPYQEATLSRSRTVRQANEPQQRCQTRSAVHAHLAVAEVRLALLMMRPANGRLAHTTSSSHFRPAIRFARHVRFPSLHF
jgi:hypothetical protein